MSSENEFKNIIQEENENLQKVREICYERFDRKFKELTMKDKYIELIKQMNLINEDLIIKYLEIMVIVENNKESEKEHIEFIENELDDLSIMCCVHSQFFHEINMYNHTALKDIEFLSKNILNIYDYLYYKKEYTIYTDCSSLLLTKSKFVIEDLEKMKEFKTDTEYLQLKSNLFTVLRSILKCGSLYYQLFESQTKN
jgi:hypothetical protein